MIDYKESSRKLNDFVLWSRAQRGCPITIKQSNWGFSAEEFINAFRKYFKADSYFIFEEGEEVEIIELK